ncbi:DNA-protecting protein DprA [Rouxiella badensis]|jgi:DNA processing protein|uniref:DNA-protecting protein DprA n=1 Tax=Rouxiella badensis TaxID=1646377 RepID=UPI0004781038|nr:DNA-protecting protein DprA [Rouxiella badensis]MCC3749667.1 DNA-protecting protein DprA [Rouxiella badensis]QII36224.1 DNA-protecting protein DprA [Rouxiella badensis]QOI56744.1 DNA-protecting protein DprA [Rouxiella badensis subsp. acadiensis]WAT08567.1 DNA-protecting protein DprA [Rouxiella badensis]
MAQREVWLRLSEVKGLGVMRLCQLADCLAETPRHTPALLRSLGLTEAQISAFFHPRSLDISASLRWAEREGHHLVALNSPAYPSLLKQIASPPRLLYVKGPPELLASPQLAMVGSRNCSHYGEHWAQYFAARLVNSGFTLTSGLAMGIDGICHRATLEAQGKTVAVLGNGLQHVHPRCHIPLAERILENGGVLVSEFSLETPPLPHNFPRRNRIISGLSVGVLIVEASLRSGSLITARCALEQGREVFALPGSVDNPNSEGAHWLIKQGAYLVTDPLDIAEHIGSGLTWLSVENSSFFGNPSLIREKIAPDANICAEDTEVELPFVDVLANVGYEVTPVDVVAERAGQPVPVVAGQLLELELAGWIAAVSGGYVRIRRAGHVRRTNVLI